MRKRKSSLRRIVSAIFAVGVVVALIHIVHALTLDRIIEYREVDFSSPGISAEMDGYRIALITDTHDISEERLGAVVMELNERRIDLLLLGGDYSSRSFDILRTTMEMLSEVQTTDGAFGVAGNHDTLFDLYPTMEANGITPLSNSGLHPREGFFLAGVQDLQTGRPDVSRATSGAMHGDFVLLLSHNPEIGMRQDTTGVDLILSGHTHGGQVTFFGLWAPALAPRFGITRYGQRFMSGWAYSRDGTPVFVSNGTGEYFPRVFARPQVVLITLRHEP
ncbi:MAG: metallophosphoesterase [Oscillospiraceae bacterium]|nr:metallophosphoesterase [Oscillospiraceae bacterium]